MSKETKIEWADSTLNFWSGCTKVSAGCAKCYAETLSNRKLTNKAGELNIGQWGKGALRKRHQSAFNLALQLNKCPMICDTCGGHFAIREDGFGDHYALNAEHICDGETFHRRRVFSLSLGDWLDPEVPIESLAEMLDTVRQCGDLQWLLVTKRPELWRERIEAVRDFAATQRWGCLWDWCCSWLSGNPRKHIMVLTSVENQQAADERIPVLLDIPATQHGLSCEPLIGPVNLDRFFWDKGMDRMWPKKQGERIDWVIVGGESGPGARECNVDWIRSVVEQCRAAGVAAFVKQLGASPVGRWTESPAKSGLGEGWPASLKITHKKGGDITEWPADLRVRQFPEV